MPNRCVLYDVTKAPYNASTSSNDNTSAIQAALNQASADGGGIVFIPNGKYKVRGHLDVPSNVELRGNVDLQTVPHGSGTILEHTKTETILTAHVSLTLKLMPDLEVS